MDRQRQGPSPFMAGIFGVVVGAAIGSLTVVFSNPKNREKVKNYVGDLDRETRRQLAELKKMITQAEEEGKNKLAGNLKRAAHYLEEGKN